MSGDSGGGSTSGGDSGGTGAGVGGPGGIGGDSGGPTTSQGDTGTTTAEGISGPEGTVTASDAPPGPDDSYSQALAESLTAEAAQIISQARAESISQAEADAVTAEAEAVLAEARGDATLGNPADGPAAGTTSTGKGQTGDGVTAEGDTGESDTGETTTSEVTVTETPGEESVESLSTISDSQSLAETLAAEARAYLDSQGDTSADGQMAADTSTGEGQTGDGPTAKGDTGDAMASEATLTETTPSETTPEVTPDEGENDGEAAPQATETAKTDQVPSDVTEVPAPLSEPEVVDPVTEPEFSKPLTEPEIPAPVTEPEFPEPPTEPEIPDPVTEPEIPDLVTEPGPEPVVEPEPPSVPKETEIPDPPTVAEPSSVPEIPDPRSVQETPDIIPSEAPDQHEVQEKSDVVPLEVHRVRNQAEHPASDDSGRADKNSMDSPSPEPSEGIDLEPAEKGLGPLEGRIEFPVYDPISGDEIVDIDRIENDILWEEKSAISAIDQKTGRDITERWISKHIGPKVDKYRRARAELPEHYQNAAIGFDFVRDGVDPDFKKAVENEVSKMRASNPDIEIHLRWRR